MRICSCLARVWAPVDRLGVVRMAAAALAVLALTVIAPAQEVPGAGDAPPLPTPPVEPQPAVPDAPSPATGPARPITPRRRELPASPPGESGRDMARMVQRSATGLALPNEPIDADLQLKADRTTTWQTDGTHFLLLENDVEVAIGSYGFAAERAVIMIAPHPLPGRTAHDVSVYFQNVKEIGGYGPVTQAAQRLLVTSVLTGKVKLTTDLMQREEAAADPLVQAARQRVQRYRESLATNTVPLPEGQPLYPPTTFAQREARREQIAGTDQREVPAEVMRPLPPGISDEPLPGEATAQVPGTERPRAQPQVDFNAGRVVFRKGEDEGYLLLVGNVQVMYVEPGTSRRVALTADRAVIFTDPDITAVGGGGGSSGAQKIRGVYLEDNVLITDGQYTLRGPRVFYDLQNERAVVLEAVFFTWDVERQLPIYVRAERIRQQARDQWSARNAYLTTSEFAEPHFAIGLKSLTIDQDTMADGRPSYDVTAEGVTFNIVDVPVFYWPSMAGSGTDLPLRSVNAGYSSRRGAVMETRWDLFALTNTPKPQGVDAELLVDGYSKRGPAVGIEMDYDVPEAFGEFNAYYLHDSGEDEPGGRLDVDPQTENRGRILWRHRHELTDDWEATAELAYLSDPTFLEEFFREDAYAEKPYETLLYLKKQQEDWAFTFLAKYDLLDFMPQTDQLQTAGNILEPGDPAVGYSTHKLPELAYYRIGTPLWANRLTWHSENRASVMRLNLPEDTPRERGFNAAESIAIFGIANQTHFNDALEAAGLDDDTRYRIDTRQEVAAPMKLGIVNVTPYVTGRLTAYDDDFEQYHGGEDSVRLWAGAGTRLSTSFTNTWNDVENRLLDLHRMRHVVEPYADLMVAGTTIEQEELPVYDYDVESLAEGAVFSIGVRNTLKTQRGGEGRWRSVDWVRLDSRFVFDSDETEVESPIARFFPFRPENSLFGDHTYQELELQVSDTLVFSADANYNFDNDDIAQWNLGFTLDHTPRLATFIFYRDIEAIESAIIQYGFEYLLTPKYQMAYVQSYDTEHGENRNVTLTVTRRLPRWLLVVALDFDQIEDITSIGVALAPEGFGGSGDISRNPFLFREP